MRMHLFGTICAITLLTGCSTDRLSTASPVRCAIRLADRPRPAGQGMITKLLSRSEAMALLSRTEQLAGGPIDGAYIDNVRAVVAADDGLVKTILIPYDMTTAVGDRVAFESAYLSPAPLCAYVPNLATRRIP